MVGMMTEAQGQAPAQPQAQPAQPQGAPQQGMPQNQENEQQLTQLDGEEAYNVAAGQILNFLYEDNGRQNLISMAKSSEPGAAMARMLSRLLVTVEQGARLSGQKIPPDALFASGIEVSAAMSEILQEAGVLSKDNEKEVTETAFFDAIGRFGQEISEEALSAEDREMYVALIEQLEAMGAESGAKPPEAPAPEQQQEEPA